MRKRSKASFDPKKFLAKVGEGKTISKYQKDQVVFSQGEVADAVFYIQQGKIKLTVVSEQGKEAVVAILGPGHFFGEGCLNGHPLRIATAGYPEVRSDHHHANSFRTAPSLCADTIFGNDNRKPHSY